MRKFFVWLMPVLSMVLPTPLQAAEPDPTFRLQSGEQVLSFTRSELLKRPDIHSFHVEHDPSYGDKPRDYAHVVPLRALFQGLKVAPDALLQFQCLDGFSAPLSKERLLGAGAADSGSIPLLAIEGSDEKWPLTSGGKSAGPFYLIWQSPEKSKIVTEEWPFSLAAFVVKDSLRTSFPKIFPASGLSKNSPVERGFKVFTQNCFACHTLNLEGQSKLGPDLNVPMNPTEYFSEANLKRLIRNPQSLRHWPESKMTGFSASAMPDVDVSAVIAYLRHMAGHKVAVPL